MFFASCASVTAPLCATSNPVGNKCGESSYKYSKLWGGKRNADCGIDKAAKNAGITKISHVDQNVKSYGFLGLRVKVTTRVYGE
ncbi:MAG: hypothetical protein IJ494_09460 [Bacteroides sp.]|nr:hypothetical protein [Bacteroides sp.]